MVKRLFKYGELPLVLLALLQTEPLNGYELMAEIDRLFGSRYSASPGSIYPALSALEKEGLIRARDSASSKEYEVTRIGARALESRLDQLTEFELRSGVHLHAMDIVESELAHLTSVVRAAKGRVSPQLLARMLKLSRKKVVRLVEKEED